MKYAKTQSFLLFLSLFANHEYCVTMLVTSLISSLYGIATVVDVNQSQMRSECSKPGHVRLLVRMVARLARFFSVPFAVLRLDKVTKCSFLCLKFNYFLYCT